jgi:hypothetical protein
VTPEGVLGFIEQRVLPEALCAEVREHHGHKAVRLEWASNMGEQIEKNGMVDMANSELRIKCLHNRGNRIY